MYTGFMNYTIPSRASDAGPDRYVSRLDRDEDGLPCFDRLPSDDDEFVSEDPDPCPARELLFRQPGAPSKLLDALRSHDETCLLCVVLRAQEAAEWLIEQRVELLRIDLETGCTALEMRKRPGSDDGRERRIA